MKDTQPEKRNPYLLTWGDRWYRIKTLWALNCTAIFAVGILLGTCLGTLLFADLVLGVSLDVAMLIAIGATLLAILGIGLTVKTFRNRHDRKFYRVMRHRTRHTQPTDVRQRRPAKGSLDDYNVNL